MSTSAGDFRDAQPRLRGVSHAYAFWAALAAAITFVALAATPSARVAAAVYGAGLCALFAGSGLYHRWPWHPRWRPLLRRIDHSTIFVFIAASYTPIALLALSGPLSIVVLVLVWAGALAGVDLQRRLDRRAARARRRLLPRARMGRADRDAAARQRPPGRCRWHCSRSAASSTPSAPRSTPSSDPIRGRTSSASTSCSTRS